MLCTLPSVSHFSGCIGDDQFSCKWQQTNKQTNTSSSLNLNQKGSHIWKSQGHPVLGLNVSRDLDNGRTCHFLSFLCPDLSCWLYFEALHGDKMALRMFRLYSSPVYVWWRIGGWIDLLSTISIWSNSNWPELRINSFLNQQAPEGRTWFLVG